MLVDMPAFMVVMVQADLLQGTPASETNVKARLTSTNQIMSDVVSMAPSTPAGSELGDNALLTADELVTDRCCTCKKPVDEHNSLVIVRADAKRQEIRRCKACNNLRSALNRLANRHGSLVKDFTKVEGSKLQAFYEAHAHLRGDDLRVKVEEVVQDWKTSTTKMEFEQEGEFYEEADLRLKYHDRPETLNNILRNARTFFCPVKRVTLYADPKYKARVADTVEYGTTEKIKGQNGLEDTTTVPPNKRTRTTKDPKQGDTKEKKWTASVKNKVTKKMEQVTTKGLQLKDLVSKANSFGSMIPSYVLDHAAKTLKDAETEQASAQDALNKATGDDKALQDSLDAIGEKVKEAAARVKSQLEQAAAFK